jgi:signal transduction histidine kinase
MKYGFRCFVFIVVILIIAPYSMVLGTVLHRTSTTCAQKYSTILPEKLSDSARVEHINQRIHLLLRQGTDSALTLAQENLARAQRYKLARSEAEALRTLATVYYYRGSYKEASLYYDKALAAFKALNDTIGIASTLNGKGVQLMKQARYDSSLICLIQSLQLREVLRDTNGMGATLNNIGLVYRNQNDYVRALEYYFQALRFKEHINDSLGISNALNTIAEIYVLQQDYDRALEFQLRALRLRRAVNNMRGVATSLNALGTIYRKRGDYNRAARYLDTALQLRRKQDDPDATITTLGQLSEVMLERRLPAQAELYATEGLVLAERIGSLRQRMNALHRLARVYAAQQNNKAAYERQRQAYALKDSVYSVEVAQKLADAQTRYDVEQKNRAIALLQNAEQLQRLQRNSLLVGLALLVVIVALLLVLWIGGRRARRQLERANAEIQAQRDIIASRNALLEENNQQLVALNNDKDRFLGIAAHDLKNPLSSIYSMAEMLLAYEHEYTHAEQKAVLEQITSSSERMFKLITDLLDVNMIESGKLTPTLLPLEIGSVVVSIVEQHKPRATQKNITLHVRADGESLVLADEAFIGQIMDNLVSNAIKFSPRDRNVFVRVHTTHNSVYIEVQDEGPGISEEESSKLFVRFSRLSAQPTAGEHSTGLGLSIVKNLVEAMNGRVWCESEVGKGAVFIVELPSAR